MTNKRRTRIFDSADPCLPDVPEDVLKYEREERMATEMENYSRVVYTPLSKRFSKQKNSSAKERRSLDMTNIWKRHKSEPFPDSMRKSQRISVDTIRLPSYHSVHRKTLSEDPQITRRERARRRYSTLNSTHDEIKMATERRRPGWEPGVNIQTTDVILNSVGSNITIVDYSMDRHRVAKLEVGLGDHANIELKDALHKRPEWSKVRWINVNGISWEAIAAVGETYNLHRLAVEDMVDIPQRTKMDSYYTHTFCCLPLHKLIDYDIQRRWKKDKFFFRFGPQDPEFHLASSPKSSTDEKKNATIWTEEVSSDRESASSEPSVAEKLAQTQMRTIYQWNNPEHEINARSLYLEARRPLANIKKAVGMEQVSLFLAEENIVISFFEKSAPDIENPILSRLSAPSTVLKESEDSSMLLQAIIDAVVDLIHPIIAAYRRRLDELQADAILRPSMLHTQELHFINAELTLLRNSIVPITVLANSLRDHSGSQDANRQISSQDMEDEPGQIEPDKDNAPRKIKRSRMISDMAAIYMADVVDHTLAYTQDLDVMRNNSKSMIDLIFNTISIRSSDAVRLLSLVTVIFLPLSFLASYFGMNFTEFDSLNNDVGYYWGVSIPFAVLLTAVLMWEMCVAKFRLVLSWALKKLDRRKQAKKAKQAAHNANNQVAPV
uniref:ARAD1C39006p n=1 Tax=Blastobotrys adeninivorans TaxID=409370 RepID=A0A060T3A0_BLAAD